MHLLGGGGVKQHVLKTTHKAFKDETKSYCLSAARAKLWRIARTVLHTIGPLNSLVGEAKRETKCDNAIPVLTGEGTGQQCSVGHARFP